MVRAVRIVPQARARNVERLGRYHRTLHPGLNLVIPYFDRVHPMIDLREQVVSFQPQPVITEDNLVVEIDTVLYFQVTDPRAAAYEIANFLQGVEQLTVTTLRNVVGSMDLERTLTSRDTINSQLRGVLDEATGKWGLRVNRVEIKAIDPPQSIKDAMEKQMRAERDKRAAILGAEGQRQSQILTAEGDKQAAVLRAEGNRTAAILKAEGQARAIDEVFQSVHRNDPDPKLLAYQYLQMLPQLAQGPGNTFWVIPSEVTSALQDVSRAFTQALPKSSATRETSSDDWQRTPPPMRSGGTSRGRRRGRRRGRGRRLPDRVAIAPVTTGWDRILRIAEHATGTRSLSPLLSRRARVLCRQRWPFFTTARRAESGGRVRQLVVVRCGRLPQRPGHGAVDRLAIFVAVELVVSSTALMLGYRTRSVVVPAARPNGPMAPYRTRVMRRSRLSVARLDRS